MKVRISELGKLAIKKGIFFKSKGKKYVKIDDKTYILQRTKFIFKKNKQNRKK